MSTSQLSLDPGGADFPLGFTGAFELLRQPGHLQQAGIGLLQCLDVI